MLSDFLFEINKILWDQQVIMLWQKQDRTDLDGGTQLWIGTVLQCGQTGSGGYYGWNKSWGHEHCSWPWPGGQSCLLSCGSSGADASCLGSPESIKVCWRQQEELLLCVSDRDDGTMFPGLPLFWSLILCKNVKMFNDVYFLPEQGRITVSRDGLWDGSMDPYFSSYDAWAWCQWEVDGKGPTIIA